MNYIQELLTLFRNKALNSMGVERDIFQLIRMVILVQPSL